MVRHPAKLKSKQLSEYVPKSLIGGSIRIEKGVDPEQVAYHAAALALDSELLCLITSVSGNKVHYLAAAATDFSSSPESGTILASALPGTPLHKGPGAYFAATGDNKYVACILSTEHGIKCFIGNAEDAHRFPAVEGMPELPLIELTNSKDSQKMAWRPFRVYRSHKYQVILKQIQISFLAYACLMTLIWFGALGYRAWQSAPIEDMTAHAKETASTVQEIVNNANRHSVWREFQMLSQFVVENKGRITSFQLTDKKLTWTLEVPTFLTGEQITSALGNGINVAKRADRIEISKK